MSKAKQFDSVWDAIEDTPQQAASMRARRVADDTANRAKVSGKTPASAARLLGNTQPLISDLMRGKIGLFPLQALIDMASIAGLEPHITLKKPNSSCEQCETELATT